MSEREPVRAMILAAGRGTRLRPLTDTVPKPLVEVAGRRLIDYALDTVARSGIRDVVINVHHFADAVRAAVGDGGDRGLHVEFSVETELLDSGGGILAARPLLGGATVVTLNADTIVDVDLGELVRWHRRRAAIATLLVAVPASAAAVLVPRPAPEPLGSPAGSVGWLRRLGRTGTSNGTATASIS